MLDLTPHDILTIQRALATERREVERRARVTDTPRNAIDTELTDLAETADKIKAEISRLFPKL